MRPSFNPPPIGSRFGKLEVVRIARDARRHGLLCRCDCGAEVLQPAYALRGGKVNSCGCGHRSLGVGTRKEKLVVEAEIYAISDRERLLRCRCDCGQFVDIPAKRIRRAFDCGCGSQQRRTDANEARKRRTLEEREKPARRAKEKHAAYRWRAKNRGHAMDLSLEEFEALANAPCRYCGASDGLNGVDRIDSSIGYLKENCAPCCSACNLMKNAMPVEVFLAQVIRIAEHTKARRS